MNFTTRILDQGDFDSLSGLYRSKNRWMESPVSDEFMEENLEVARKNYLSRESDRRILLGTFADSRLVFSGGLYLWFDLPFCTIVRLVGDTTELDSRAVVKAMTSLFDGFLNEIEKRQIGRFYLLTSAHHLSSMAKIGRFLPRLRRDYAMTVEEVVPAGARPRFPYVWSIMGEKVWPVTLVIRAGTAYNHVRTFDKTVVGEDIINAWATHGDAEAVSGAGNSGAEGV